MLLASLDPGSGSLIIRVLMASVVGIAATFRLWKSRLLSPIGVRRDTKGIKGADDNSEKNRDKSPA